VTFEVRLPRLAESISDAVLVEWLKPDGALVEVDEPIATLETDKAAVEIAAEQRGVLRHARAVQERLQVGDVLARIEDGAGAPASATPARAASPAPVPAATPAPASMPPAAPARAASAPPAPPAPAPAPAAAAAPEAPPLSPAVRRLVEEHAIDPAKVAGSGKGGRLLKEDVLREIERGQAAPAPSAGPPAGVTPAAPPAPAPAAPSRGAEEADRIVPMSTIRLRIAERLVRAQHTAAILTTFNEIDMSAVLELRARYREDFERRHGVRLGFMSFFARASILALQEFPELNAEIRGTDIVYHPRVHLGIAVQTERGLVVPVVRAADRLAFAAIEREIARLAERARGQALSLDELSGGTFTISNGGVYGSLMSTPILNPPQSGILGMHKIEKRPVAVSDQVAIRSMMYVALSYDHRIVDGEQAVTFLVRVKERVEDPERMLLEV